MQILCVHARHIILTFLPWDAWPGFSCSCLQMLLVCRTFLLTPSDQLTSGDKAFPYQYCKASSYRFGCIQCSLSIHCSWNSFCCIFSHKKQHMVKPFLVQHLWEMIFESFLHTYPSLLQKNLLAFFKDPLNVCTEDKKLFKSLWIWPSAWHFKILPQPPLLIQILLLIKIFQIMKKYNI